MRTVYSAVAMLVAVATAGCGAAGASSSGPTPLDGMRAAAVRLMLADVNATALPQGYDTAVLRRRMSRYVASRWLDRRVVLMESSIAKVGGRRYFQPWVDAITVGRWEGESVRDDPATVVFTGYETISPSYGPAARPMELFTVRMVRELGRWRLATYDSSWLTPDGPMGASGADTIRDLPLKVVFRNPRPHGWRYRGPSPPPDGHG